MYCGAIWGVACRREIGLVVGVSGVVGVVVVFVALAVVVVVVGVGLAGLLGVSGSGVGVVFRGVSGAFMACLAVALLFLSR